ncbi:MAG TPA: tetratricopeptide repeat protein [Steroidobacteraceae bacterium]|nr:tetratricopeptide repeat protein [Steroidobacteraceae bacterium]
MSAESTGKGSNERWEQLQELFSRAVDLSGPDRKTFVEKETAGDAALRAELLELLACDNGGARTGPLTLALGAALDTTTRDRRKALVGRTLGNYKLVSVLGHGGTGTVYLGERADRQYSAQVAVKIVDNGTMQGELGLRFRAERQILASLNHPNIARLIDAGETEEGNPYLVMEYVHGEPLDRYCDREQLGVRERLQLFLDICGAVQYAHQNLVVHRDLKPANILVTAEGAPKLLDFGIAKLLDAGEAAAAMALTRMNDRLLTPEYASPEQILGRPVTTASDVYALGVVLYELLTGLRPYVVPASASQLELERSICITDPLRPSAAVKRAIESGPLEGQSEILAVAAARRLTADKLRKRLVGDIDAIVMRALRKEPQHRYNSIEQLQSDVRRFLTREPVQARQGNWLYYSQRFIRRHAFGVTAGAAFVLFIVAFAVAMTVQRTRVQIEGTNAATVSEWMLQIFDSAQPQTSLGQEIRARDILDTAGRRIRDDLTLQPEVRARLLEAIGRAYRRLDLHEQAVPYFEDALRLRHDLPDPDGSKTASLLIDLAISLRETDDLTRADTVLKQALTISQAHETEKTDTYARLLLNLGRVQLNQGNLSEARTNFEKSIALGRELGGSMNPEVASGLRELSSVFMWNDDLPAAERSVRESVKIFTATRQHGHPDLVLAEHKLAEVLMLEGRYEEAAPLFESSLAAQMRLYGSNSPKVADVLESLANIRRVQGSLAEAEDYARQALRTRETALGREDMNTGYSCTMLAIVLTARGKYEEAEQVARQSLAIFDKTLPPDHQYVAASEHVLGEVLLAKGELAAAESTLTGAVNRWKRTKAPAWRIARSESALGEAIYRQGRAAEAERYLVGSYRVLAAETKADREARVKAQDRITRFYTDRGERSKLEALLATGDPPKAQDDHKTSSASSSN